MRKILSRFVNLILHPVKEWEKIKAEPDSFKFLISYCAFFFGIRIVLFVIAGYFNLYTHDLSKDSVYNFLILNIKNLSSIIFTGLFFFLLFRLFKKKNTLFDAFSLIVFPYSIFLLGFVLSLAPFLIYFGILPFLYITIVFHRGIQILVEIESKIIRILIKIIVFLPVSMMLFALFFALFNWLLLNGLYLFF